MSVVGIQWSVFVSIEVEASISRSDVATDFEYAFGSSRDGKGVPCIVSVSCVWQIISLVCFNFDGASEVFAWACFSKAYDDVTVSSSSCAWVGADVDTYVKTCTFLYVDFAHFVS